jgi:colanic acid biosynthesis protein WcaH
LKLSSEPAFGTWFVQGGRFNKGETLDAALVRIAVDELGPGDWSRESARPLGVFEHFYDTNFTRSNGAGAHCVVAADAIDADQLCLDRLRLDCFCGQGF